MMWTVGDLIVNGGISIRNDLHQMWGFLSVWGTVVWLQGKHS